MQGLNLGTQVVLVILELFVRSTVSVHPFLLRGALALPRAIVGMGFKRKLGIVLRRLALEAHVPLSDRKGLQASASLAILASSAQ